MAFDFCCFISYPHGQDDVLVPFVKDFVEGLSKEVKSQSRTPIWIDYQYLKGGSRIGAKIGPSICKSACMIVFYTPLYFDAEHTYCARELRAMEKLEAARLAHLKDKSDGLIITVILRGAKKFPKALEDRKFYRFDDIDLNDPVDKIQFRYKSNIREIAEYILERYDSLVEVAGDIKQDCDAFCLPSEEEARDYVAKLLGRKEAPTADPFPGGAGLTKAETEGEPV
ncbi:MAG TPA: toll/interleukin-1 receptor domain-containing protein [Pyrinomonadaceae bacterium]|jgi:hypothetical protein